MFFFLIFINKNKLNIQHTMENLNCLEHKSCIELSYYLHVKYTWIKLKIKQL